MWPHSGQWNKRSAGSSGKLFPPWQERCGRRKSSRFLITHIHFSLPESFISTWEAVGRGCESQNCSSHLVTVRRHIEGDRMKKQDEAGALMTFVNCETSFGTHYLQTLVQYTIYILMIWATDYWVFQMQPNCPMYPNLYRDLKFWNNSSVAWKRETKCHIKGLVEGEDLTIVSKALHRLTPSQLWYHLLLLSLAHSTSSTLVFSCCSDMPGTLPPQCLCTCCSHCLEYSPSTCLHGFLSCSHQVFTQKSLSWWDILWHFL